MPATLSVMPWVPVATAAGAAGARPAHAAQVATPSGICVPHMLQKAMVALRVEWSAAEAAVANQAATARKYQKGMRKANHILAASPECQRTAQQCLRPMAVQRSRLEAL